MKFVLKLKNKKMPGVKKITRIPGIDTIITKKSGKLYQVRYFVDVGKGPKMIGFTSKDPSFKKIYSFDVFDLTLKPVAMFKLRDGITEEELLNFVSSVITTTKYKMPRPVKESKEILDELGIGTILGAVPPELKPILIMFGVIYGLMFAIPILLQFRNTVVKISNWAQERYVAGPAETKINQLLFQGQTKDDPAFAVYKNLADYIQFIIEKKANALIVCGPPGMSKTYTVRRTLHFAGKKPLRDYTIEKGATLGLLATYSLLYKNKKRLLILDDFDTPLSDPDIVNMLKSVTDTYTKRILSLPREKILGTLDKGEQMIGVPEKFEFEGQLIIITNLTKGQIDPALLSRAPAFQVNYNTKEVLASTQKMLKYINPAIPMKFKQEAYDYILLLYKHDKNINLSFRSVKSAVDARVGNPIGWRDMVKIIVQYKGGNITERYLQILNTSS
jgi:hypothetical protein